jgi:HlyD family secretion protein
MSKPRRAWKWIAAGVLVGAIAALARTGAEQSANVAIVTAEERSFETVVPFTGRVRALQVAQYGPPQLTQVWEYRITELAREGAEVAAGDMVIQFDTTELEESLRRHQAERDAAATEYQRRSRDFEAERSGQELALEEAKAQEQRAQIGVSIPSELVARSTLEKAAVDLELARAELGHRTERIADLGRRSATELAVLRDRRDRAAAAVAEIERSIGLMTVRATSPGIVSHRADRRGNKKKVGDSSWRGERLVEIPAPGALRIDAWVREADSGSLRVGLPATAWLEAHADRAFTSRVVALQQTVERRTELDPGPVVRLELSIEGQDEKPIHPGMRVQGRIEIERRPARLAVRVAAVTSGPAGPTVLEKTLFGVTPRPIEVGVSDGEWVEILSGLDAGDRVVMPR